MTLGSKTVLVLGVMLMTRFYAGQEDGEPGMPSSAGNRYPSSRMLAFLWCLGGFRNFALGDYLRPDWAAIPKPEMS